MKSHFCNNLFQSHYFIFFPIIFLVCDFLVVVGIFIIAWITCNNTFTFLVMSLFAILNVNTLWKVLIHLTEMTPSASILEFTETKVWEFTVHIFHFVLALLNFRTLLELNLLTTRKKLSYDLHRGEKIMLTVWNIWFGLDWIGLWLWIILSRECSVVPFNPLNTCKCWPNYSSYRDIAKLVCQLVYGTKPWNQD